MDDAHELNRELTRLLCEAGERLGFTVRREYALPGGRLDVVWTQEVPIHAHPLPVVGFEIESSWRTRKHVKGDLLNLTDAGVSLGVIVLAGETARDDDLRRFADALVSRPGPPILVWTRSDVYDLARGVAPSVLPSPTETPRAPIANVASSSGQVRGSKYEPLVRWLDGQGPSEVRARFDQIEGVLGFALPASAREHSAWWSKGSVAGRAIATSGWRSTQVNLTVETIVFVRS